MNAVLKTLCGALLILLTVTGYAQEKAPSSNAGTIDKAEFLKRLPPPPTKDGYIDTGLVQSSMGTFQVSIRKSSIRFNEDHRAVAELIWNFVEPVKAEDKQFLSMASGFEFDCTDPGVERRVSSELFPQNYAQGKGFGAQKQNGKWDRVSNDSPFKAVGELVCKIADLNSYTAALSTKIRKNVVIPPNVKGNPAGTFRVTRKADGEVVDLSLVKSTGDAELDKAIENGIRKSSPLPVPADMTTTTEFQITYVPFDKPSTN